MRASEDNHCPSMRRVRVQIYSIGLYRNVGRSTVHHDIFFTNTHQSTHMFELIELLVVKNSSRSSQHNTSNRRRTRKKKRKKTASSVSIVCDRMDVDVCRAFATMNSWVFFLFSFFFVFAFVSLKAYKREMKRKRKRKKRKCSTPVGRCKARIGEICNLIVVVQTGTD